jgi:excisionase family DNA binding protein
MKTETRVDASQLTEEERGLLKSLLELEDQRGQPCLKGANGEEIRLPETIFRVLMKVIRDMQQGKSILLIRQEETFTTQAAANFLGMSRQHLVTLIEGGKIPFHRVGAHRRLYFKDLTAFARKRDEARRDGMGRLFKKLHKEGYYDTEYTGGNAH